MRPVPLKTVQGVMESLGYVAHPIEGGRIVFTHPRRSLFIVIPGRQEGDTVRPIDLLSIRNTLINDGVIRDDEQFESLFRMKKEDELDWTHPTGERIDVFAASNGERLSDREREVLRLIGHGIKTAEIARTLHLSVRTVETYRDRIRQKLDLSDGTELARYATHWVLENG